MIRDYSLPMPELPGRVDWPLLEAAWHSLQQTINIGPPREDGKEAVIAEDQSMDRRHERRADLTAARRRARKANEPGIEINWGGKKYEFASAAEALRAGFHL